MYLTCEGLSACGIYLEGGLYSRVIFNTGFYCTYINDDNLSWQVIVCGGGASVPVVQKTISDMFSHCDILNSINPEEVIAVGAAKQVCLFLVECFGVQHY